MLHKNSLRILIAAATDVLAFIVLIICYFVCTRNNFGAVTMANALWMPAVCALLDIPLTVLFDTLTKSRGVSLIKDAVYIVILVINVVLFILTYVHYFTYLNTDVTMSMVADVAVWGLLAIGVPLKFLLFHMYDEADLPETVAPFISAGSMLAGYIFYLILLAIGSAISINAVQIVLAIILILLPVGGFIAAIIYKTKEIGFSDFFFPFTIAPKKSEGYYGGSSGSSSNSSSRTKSSTGSGTNVESILNKLAADYSSELTSNSNYGNYYLEDVKVSVEFLHFDGSVSGYIHVKGRARSSGSGFAKQELNNIIREINSHRNDMDREINDLLRNTSATAHVSEIMTDISVIDDGIDLY